MLEGYPVLILQQPTEKELAVLPVCCWETRLTCTCAEAWVCCVDSSQRGCRTRVCWLLLWAACGALPAEPSWGWSSCPALKLLALDLWALWHFRLAERALLSCCSANLCLIFHWTAKLMKTNTPLECLPLIKKKIFNVTLLRSACSNVTNCNFEILFKTSLIQHLRKLLI